MKTTIDRIQGPVQLATLVVITCTLIAIAVQSCTSISQVNLLNDQTEYLAEQVNLLGNQTKDVAEQTDILISDYIKRTRPYLAVEEIIVQEGNDSEHLDIKINVENFGQVPATKISLGNPSENQPGLVIGGEDVSYDENTGAFILKGECTNECPPCQAAICACPCYIPRLTLEDLPADLIFFPGRDRNLCVPAHKSDYAMVVERINMMHIALRYYWEGTEYYYIARATMRTDGSWIIEEERGN